MASSRKNFDSVVAARTRTAVQISGTPELLLAFTSLGGLKEDLEAIASAGREAEALSQAQGSARSDGKTATAQTLLSFTALQTEYSLVMAVVRAVRADLERKQADTALLTRLGDIIANTAAVTVEIHEQPDGKQARTTSKAASQEAIRAEIQRDAEALASLTGAQQALAARKVDGPRLAALRDAAKSLSGKLADRAAKKGAAKGATQLEHDAVRLQRSVWGGVYGILSALGRKDSRVAMLLREARG